MHPTTKVESHNKTQDLRGVTRLVRLQKGWQGALRSAAWTLAFGSILVFSQSYALSIDEIRVNSALGEPLDAVVQINAAPGETLAASCIRTGAEVGSAMPAIRGVRLSLSRQISPGTLRLTTSRPINEPMSELVVHVECPGAPAVKRSFLIMLDPRNVIESRATPAVIDTATTVPAVAPVIRSENARVSVRSRQVVVYRGENIRPGERYVVVNGDALSTIAARIEGREYGTVWSWSATIEAANPHAFINGNPNELIAGSELYIPERLAPGTAGLTVPASPVPSDSSAATSDDATPSTRYAERLSQYDETRSTPSDEGSSNSPKSDSVMDTPLEPLAFDTSSAPIQSGATGNIGAIKPVMVMATSFSSVSRERILLRKVGRVEQAPANLPSFVDDDRRAQVANTDVPEPAPEPEERQVPAAANESAVVVASSERRFSILGVAGGLLMLLSAFFAGWWLSRRRADATMADEIEARLNHERYRARVRTNRQAAIRESISGPTIHVSEAPQDETVDEVEPAAEVTNPTPAAPVIKITEEDIDEVIGSVVKEEERNTLVQETYPTDQFLISDGPLIDPDALGLDTTSEHELADIDLELLERDYAAQTETNTNLEDIANAGRGAPPVEGLVAKDGEPIGQETIEFTAQSDSKVDFDIGSSDVDEDTSPTEPLGLDLEEAGATIDAHLQKLREEDKEREHSDFDPEATTALKDAAALEAELDELIIENLVDNEELTHTSQLDGEEFYHLEASSIMNVGELNFEKDADDETNILRFRQRNIRTGTDDNSGEE
ncbi:MAG: hypothetical protein AAF465_00915 [Pseudomonadota bacterium]